MTSRMLAKFRSLPPKLKLVLGFWFCFELLSLPAAAGAAWSLQKPSETPSGPMVVEAMASDVPGVTQYLVTYASSFDVVVGGAKTDLQIKVEDAKYEQPLDTSCARLTSTATRLVQTVAVPNEKGMGAAFVTLTHGEDAQPTIEFVAVADVPAALPCQSI